MVNFLKKSILLVIVAVALAACGGGSESSTESGPSIEFVSPKNGETVSSPVHVEMKANNFTIEEAGEVHDNAGHFHVLVDVGCNPTGEIIPGTEGYNHFGKAQMEADLELEPGEHTLCLQVGDGIHTALDIVETITITVE